jgi:hypothetical protein
MRDTPEETPNVATVDERSRHELYLSIEELIGAEKAEMLMSMLPSVGWADVATRQDLTAHQVVSRRDLAALEEHMGLRFNELEQRTDLRFEGLEERLGLRIETSAAEIRSELHKALRDQLRVVVFALFTMMSLNLTAVALLR